MPIPLSVLSTIDPVLRESAIFALLVDSPRTVVLRHDIHAEHGTLRRVVIDGTGILDDVAVELEHACLSCAVREDAIPSLADLARDGRWDDVVLALPVSAESLAVTHALSAATAPGAPLDRMRLATVVTAVDADTAEEDLLGIDSLAERGIALTDDDERSVGDALASQLEHADLVVTCSGSHTHPGLRSRCGTELVDHLRAHDSQRIDGLHEITAESLRSTTHDASAGERRCDPLHARASLCQTDHAWSLELASDRPVHPERLLERIEELGAGRLRSRGVFHVPNRADAVCHWDGAGGQLYVGTLGSWRGARPTTRLVFTGVGRGERARLRSVFEEILLTDAELADAELAWLGRPDVLEPWLGDPADLA
ncbi:CobW family GTP-binding protein [Sanguibacter antarcticus]|uniref:G3E family GTPase n=1 Tax=Sanguibacter antarcticus TaxID=372484 RepID=A0A2A9E9I4_9MICO|nr:GTP-binding protein [Sanguibacter antarcticus]PFG34902.1 G3E family GTPase [Sanguibacter antarcticus]